VFLLGKARWVFLDVTLSSLIFFRKSFRNQIAIKWLRGFALLPC